MLRGLIIMSLISMQLEYIYQAWEWLTVKNKKKQKNKTEISTKVIVPITTGASRLTAWGPGARLRAPGRDRGGEAPRSSWVLAVLEPQQGPFQIRGYKMNLQKCIFNNFWHCLNAITLTCTQKVLIFFRPIQPNKLNAFASYIKLYVDCWCSNQ